MKIERDSLVNHMQQRPRKERPTDNRRRRRLTAYIGLHPARRRHPPQQRTQLALLLHPTPIPLGRRRLARLAPRRQHPGRESREIIRDQGKNINDPIPRLPFLRLAGVHPDMEQRFLDSMRFMPDLLVQRGTGVGRHVQVVCLEGEMPQEDDTVVERPHCLFTDDGRLVHEERLGGEE